MKLRAYLYALGSLLWLALPAVAAAAGLVPCSGTACNICDFGQLLQNIVNFSIGISFPIAAVLFAYAGWLYYSNNEDSYKVQRAHKMFTTVFIGFAIVVGGWLLVQTALKTLAPGYQTWTTFDCSNLSRPMNTTIGQWFGQSGVGQVTTPPPPPVTVTTDYTGSNPTAVVCQVGSHYNAGSFNCEDSEGNPTAPVSESVASNSGSSCPAGATQVGFTCQVCYGGGYDDSGAPIASDYCEEVAPNPPLSNTDCSVTNIQNAVAGGPYSLSDSQAATLSCIAKYESNCGRDTGVAYTPSGQPTSATGMFQIVFGSGNDTCHNLNMSVCNDAAARAGYTVNGNLNCSQHFRGGQPIDQTGQACKAAALSIDCNASAAACLVQARGGGFGDWTADSRSSRQAQCIQQYSS